MNARRVALLVGAALVVASLTAQTAGVSTVDVDRTVEVTVAEDPDAYLGIEHPEPVTVSGNDSGVALLIITNRFPMEIRIRYDFVRSDLEGPPAIESWEDMDTVDSGERTAFEVTVDCENTTAAGQYTIDIFAASESVSIELDRVVTIECV